MEEVDEEGVWLPEDIAEAIDLDVKQVEEALAESPEIFDPVRAYMLRSKDK